METQRSNLKIEASCNFMDLVLNYMKFCFSFQPHGSWEQSKCQGPPEAGSLIKSSHSEIGTPMYQTLSVRMK